MITLFWIIGATILDSLIGLVGIFSFWVREKFMNRIIRTLVAFSAGALLGGAFFHLIAESAEKMDIMLSLSIVLFGFLAFFVLEGYLHWHHCEGECEIHPYTNLMIIGDSVHNVLDGLVIAGTFLVSINLGIITTLIIIAHEVPQELGAFAVLVSGGIKKSKAIIYSYLAQCTCIIGGVLGFFFMSHMQTIATYIIPFAAGSFIYIAAADLIPNMHEAEGAQKITSFVWLCLGIAFMLFIKLAFNS
jgi:zinc and cadmium transporter